MTFGSILGLGVVGAQQQAISSMNWTTNSLASSANYITTIHSVYPSIATPPSGSPADSPEVLWLKKRVREIEWHA